MAPPAFGASGTATGGGTRSTISLAAPASVVANSLLVAAFYIDGVTNQNVTLAGWTNLEGTPLAATGADQKHWLHVLWHRASGSESGPYAFVLDTAQYCEGQVHRFDGALTSGTPFESPTSTATDPNNNTTTPVVSLTTGGADRLLLHMATDWSGGTWTAPSGFTKRQQIASDGLSTLSDKAQAVAGATGSVQATQTGNGKTTALLAAMLPDAGGAATSLLIPRRPARGLVLR